MRWLRKLYYKLVPTYRRLDFKVCSWDEGERLIKENCNWVTANEDINYTYPFVALEIKERIVE